MTVVLFFIGLVSLYLGLLWLYLYDRTYMLAAIGIINILAFVFAEANRGWREVITLSLGLLYICLMWAIYSIT